MKKIIAICLATGIILATVGGTVASAAAPPSAPPSGFSSQASAAATPSAAAVTINGTSVRFEAYNISGSNYFKLRDLAAALNGTDSQFEVSYDSSTGTISLTSGKAYTANGSELTQSDNASDVTAALSAATVYLDGTKLSLTAYTIDGSTYFKLRDVAAALDIGVTYDSASGTISIDTAASYTADTSTASGTPGGPGDMPGGGAQSVDTGTGATVLSDGQTLSSGSYSSTSDDENAIRAEGAITASLSDVTVEKTGAASSSDASSFYGLNAAVLALDGATLNISGGTVTASGEGANGVFAYDGATINITDTVINVTGGNAGGIEVAGGGIMYATNLTVNTTVKAAIRSDRGGGTMVVNGGSYTTSGSSGAPAIYSTADITVSDATLTANDSEAVVVEGLNSVTLTDCDVTGNMSGTYGAASGENIHNVMLYQSMSGDAAVGTSSFSMTGGSLTSKNGDMFYVTNTSSVISLSDVELTLASGTNLLTVAGNDGARGWGTAGENGGKCTFALSDQTIAGDISVDAISTLALTMADASSFTGTINTDGTTAADLSVTLDASSTWTLTGDSYITAFNGDPDNIDTNGYTLYVNGVAYKS